MRICFDLDNTLFATEGMDYENSKPVPRMIELVNSLYDGGHEITIFTARGSGSGIDFSELTKIQLKKAGLKYHCLQFKKPPFDVFVDDRAVRFRGQSNEDIIREIEEITHDHCFEPNKPT